MIRLFRCLAGLLLLLPATLLAQSGIPGVSGNQYLSPDEAFVASVSSPSAERIVVEWTIAPEYYLYQHRFEFTIDGDASLGAPVFPEAEQVSDEYFGESLIYREQASIPIPVENGRRGEQYTVTLRFQGCADAGLCYPPLERDIPVVLGSEEAAGDTGAPQRSEQDRLAGLIADGHPALVAALFFGFGLLLSFTPCVLPMVPILSSLIIGQGEPVTTRRAFALSLTYVLAMALTYTAAGIIAGLLGHNLQASLQHPAVLISFAVVFGVLALAMFDVYQLQVPQRMQTALNRLSHRQQAGRYTGVAVMGLISALVVGPCVAAPLAGALLVIGQTGDAFRGGLALFAMSMGMGVLLLVVGTTAGRFMPRTGPWMTAVKQAFGFLLLAVGIWMLERVVPGTAALLLWAAWLVMAGIFLGALDPLARDSSNTARVAKGAGILSLTWGLILVAAAATGGQDPLRPFHGMNLASGGSADDATATTFTEIPDLEAFESRLAQGIDRPVMLDFYADWCVDCVRMERRTFPDPAVRERLTDFERLKVDVTDYNDTHRRMLEHFELFGPPALLFFDSQGREIRHLRLVGEMGPEAFADHLDRVASEFDRGRETP